MKLDEFTAIRKLSIGLPKFYFKAEAQDGYEEVKITIVEEDEQHFFRNRVVEAGETIIDAINRLKVDVSKVYKIVIAWESHERQLPSRYITYLNKYCKLQA